MGKYVGYEKYKDSGVEWLGEIPEHWEFRRIKFLCKDIISGPFGSSLTKDIYTQSGYKIYGQEQVIFDDFSIGDYYISQEKYKEMIRYNVSPGDVLVSCVGTFGKIAVVPGNVEKGIINPRLIKLNLDKQRIFPNYFGVLLSSEVAFFQFEMFSRGGTMGVVNIGTLSEIELPIPPLDEQESIAHFLDRKTSQIDTLIAKKEALLEKLDEKRTALISHAVTKGLEPNVPMKDSGVEWLGDIPKHWEVKRLRFLAVMHGGSTPNKANPEFWDGEIPWISAKDLKTERLKSSVDTITDKALQETSIHIHPKNGVVIVVRGMILAHSFPVAINDIDITINQDLKVLRTSQNPEFLAILLRGFKSIILSIMEESGHGTKVLRTDLFKNVELPHPSQIEQEKIVNYVNQKTVKIDRQKAKVKEAIELLKEYRTALITNAVTGKIDVRQVANV